MREPRSLRRVAARSFVIGALVLSGVSAGLWIANVVLGPIMISLGTDTNVRFWHGEAQFRHYYEYDVAPPIPNDQWHATAVSRGWVIPPERHPARPVLVPNFAFSSGHVGGMSFGGLTVTPARYWLLHVPLWATILPGLVTGAWLAARWRERRAARRRGFGVITTDASPSSAA